MSRLITKGVCKRTGYPVEHWQRDFRVVGDRPTFWFAYPHDRASIFQGASGDTKAQAIANMLAKQSERIAA